MKRRLVMTFAATAMAVTLGACSEAEDKRGIGDAPVAQQDDQERKVWPNGNGFPNISAFCIGGNGVYTTSGTQRPPVVVVDDPECAQGGVLLLP